VQGPGIDSRNFGEKDKGTKLNEKKEEGDWRRGSSSRVPALQTQSPD
jgi:hypothetical protein